MRVVLSFIESIAADCLQAELDGAILLALSFTLLILTRWRINRYQFRRTKAPSASTIPSTLTNCTPVRGDDCRLSNSNHMKLAFAITTIAALQQAAVTRADCGFGSNYTSYFNSSDFCSFEVGLGSISNFFESNTISSGDTNVTTTTVRRDIAIWKMGDKDSTVQCYPNISADFKFTTYPNGSTFTVDTGDFVFWLNSVNNTVADGVSLSSPGFYFFEGGNLEYWSVKDGNWDITKAEGDITNLCEVLGSGGGGGAAPTPTPPTTEAPSSGKMAALTIIPCIAATMLNYFMFI